MEQALFLWKLFEQVLICFEGMLNIQQMKADIVKYLLAQFKFL